MTVLDPDVKSVALAGDWHGNAAYAGSAIRYAQDLGAEGIVHLGDFGVWPGSAGRDFLNALDRALASKGMWLAFIDGNHEDHWQLHDIDIEATGVRIVRERIWHLPRGFRWTWQGQRWLALGGAISLDKSSRKIGQSWWPEESMSYDEMQRAINGGRADVMVTHDVPSSIPVPGLSAYGWDPEMLMKAHAHRLLLQTIVEVVQPRYLWHGHMHIAYSTTATFGDTECRVEGLNCDGEPLSQNVRVVNLAHLP